MLFLSCLASERKTDIANLKSEGFAGFYNCEKMIDTDETFRVTMKSSNLAMQRTEMNISHGLLVKRDYRLPITKCFSRTAARTFDTSATEIVTVRALAAFRLSDIFQSTLSTACRLGTHANFRYVIHFYDWHFP